MSQSDWKLFWWLNALRLSVCYKKNRFDKIGWIFYIKQNLLKKNKKSLFRFEYLMLHACPKLTSSNYGADEYEINLVLYFILFHQDQYKLAVILCYETRTADKLKWFITYLRLTGSQIDDLLGCKTLSYRRIIYLK